LPVSGNNNTADAKTYEERVTLAPFNTGYAISLRQFLQNVKQQQGACAKYF
jgi:hypothetical protein